MRMKPAEELKQSFWYNWMEQEQKEEYWLSAQQTDHLSSMMLREEDL